MTSVVPVKLTQPEDDLLEWLTHQLNLESRSQTLRLALVTMAERRGGSEQLVAQVRHHRAAHPARRCAKLVRLVGPRRKGEAGPGGNT